MSSVAYSAESVYESGLHVKKVATPYRNIDINIWYPAKGAGEMQFYGKNKVFEGVKVKPNVEVSDGKFPLILLSHGGLRASPTLSGWIASNLSSRGLIVVAVSTPFILENSVYEPWLRANDLSKSLTILLNDPEFANHIDTHKVGALGFFLGGTSSLLLSGASLDPVRYRQSCNGEGVMLDCDFFDHNGIDLNKIKSTELWRSQQDDRVKAIISIDPELTTLLSIESLKAIKAPILVVNLGKRNAIKTELEASALALDVPMFTYRMMSDATPFSAFSQCTSMGAEILKESGEDESICLETSLRSRSDIQKELSDIIYDSFFRVFGM